MYIPALKLRFSARLHGPKSEQNIDRAEIQAAVTALKIAYHYRGRFPAGFTLRTDSLNLLYFVRHWAGHWARGGWPLIREHIQVLWLQFSAIGYPAGSLHRYEEDLEELFEALERVQRGDDLTSKSPPIEVHWQKVRAHSNHHGNDVSDMLSKLGRRLPYNNAQLYNSLKLTLNLAPSSHFEQRQLVERLESLELGQNLAQKFIPNLLEVMAVPMHIPKAAVVRLLPAGAAAFLCEKNMDFGAAKDVVLRCTPELYNAFMERRHLRLDAHITCRVNPGIKQCSRCLAINDHLAKDCTSAQVRCGNCASRDHEWKGCRRPSWTAAASGTWNDESSNTAGNAGATCGNCLDEGKVGDHSAFSSQCPLRQLEQERLASVALKRVAFRRNLAAAVVAAEKAKEKKETEVEEKDEEENDGQEEEEENIEEEEEEDEGENKENLLEKTKTKKDRRKRKKKREVEEEEEVEEE